MFFGNKDYKRISFTLAAVTATSLFALMQTGCAPENNGKKTIVTTTFPSYEWTETVLGDRKDDFEVTWLASNGVDMHSFQPSAGDIALVSSCDLLIQNGGESEAWLEPIVEQRESKGLKSLNLSAHLEDGNMLLCEETVEGMTVEEKEEEEAYDEHIWLSLENASQMVEGIAGSIASIDSDNTAYYTENAEKYCEEITALETEFGEKLSGRTKPVLVADRFPFRYLTADYGLVYYAAFPGCSAETESSFETVIFLADEIKYDNLDVIYVLEKSDRKLAETVIENSGVSGVEIRELNSMQSVTMDDYANGATYIEIMKENLEALTE